MEHYDTNVTIEKRCGCTIAYGDIPLSALREILEKDPSVKGFFDMRSAKILGASFVIGTEEQLAALRKSLENEYVTRPKDDQDKKLPESVQKWLRTGERGLSSDTMCRRFFGVPEGDNTYPMDPSDLVRCIKFLKDTKTQNRLHEMKDVSKEWNLLVENWAQLKHILNKDIKNTDGKSAPETYTTMKCLEAMSGATSRKSLLEVNIDKVFEAGDSRKYVAAVLVDFIKDTVALRRFRRHFNKEIKEDLLATEIEIGGRMLSVCLHGENDITRSEAIDICNLRTQQNSRIIFDKKETFLRNVVSKSISVFDSLTKPQQNIDHDR